MWDGDEKPPTGRRFADRYVFSLGGAYEPGTALRNPLSELSRDLRRRVRKKTINRVFRSKIEKNMEKEWLDSKVIARLVCVIEILKSEHTR